MPKLFLLKLYLLFLVFINCENDEGPLPPRDVKIQTLEDDVALVNYLQTHFYNYNDFAYDPDNYELEILLDSITEENSDKTSLWDQVSYKIIDTRDRDDNICLLYTSPSPRD